jgi:FG-GAP repeat
MHPSLRLFWAGLSVLALGLAGCDGGPLPGKDGGVGGTGGRTSETDGAAGGSKMDGATGGATTDGGGTDGGGIDLVGVSPPATLTATVSDRRATTFKLLWKAPTISGATVTGYQVRYAKVPITTANFDDTTVTTAIPFTGTMNDQGAVGISVNLYIENEYYFAVEGADSAGDRSPIDATSTAVAAHFNVTTLTGASGDRMGYDVDGVGDFGSSSGLGFSADGLSDLIVGAASGEKHAYLFFGTSNGYSTTPSVTFTGSVNGFGTSVVDAGDVDGDGLDDIAIASPADGSGRVYIFSRKNPPSSWGTTNSWPAALSDTQANYVITVSTTLAAGVMDLRCLARVGNFDGGGADDLAIGLDGVNSVAGAVFIVKGSSSFASITIPNATSAIEIDGAGATGFGFANIGIGPFFQPSGGPGLVSASFLGSSAFAFPGQSPPGILTSAMASDSTMAPTADHDGRSLGFLGALGSSPAAVTVGTPVAAYVDVNLGTIATGPFLGSAGSAPTPSVHFVDSASSDSFGLINLGGGIKGTSREVSVIGGDAVPDLVLAGNEPGFPFYIVSGSSIPSLSGTVDVSKPPAGAAIVKVSGQIPTDRVGYGGASVIPDSNGDGYADFVIGESTGSPNPGRVFVFY